MNTKKSILPLALVLFLPLVYIQAKIGIDGGLQARKLDTMAERIYSDDTPIASISYLGDRFEGYAVVTFRMKQEKKYIYRGVSKVSWDHVKQSRDLMKFYREHLAHHSPNGSLLAYN